MYTYSKQVNYNIMKFLNIKPEW